jgi:hypothetical protein
MTTTTDEAREARLRRKATSHRLRLTKSRSRDPNALDYGRFALIDPQTNGTVNAALIDRYIHSWSLDDVEQYLSA